MKCKNHLSTQALSTHQLVELFTLGPDFWIIHSEPEKKFNNLLKYHLPSKEGTITKNELTSKMWILRINKDAYKFLQSSPKN